MVVIILCKYRVCVSIWCRLMPILFSILYLNSLSFLPAKAAAYDDTAFGQFIESAAHRLIVTYYVSYSFLHFAACRYLLFSIYNATHTCSNSLSCTMDHVFDVCSASSSPLCFVRRNEIAQNIQFTHFFRFHERLIFFSSEPCWATNKTNWHNNNSREWELTESGKGQETSKAKKNPFKIHSMIVFVFASPSVPYKFCVFLLFSFSFKRFLFVSDNLCGACDTTRLSHTLSHTYKQKSQWT